MLDFRLYESRDFGGCLDLIRAGHDSHFSEQRFRWLHERGPGGPSAIAIATEGTQVAGIYSVVRKPMQLGEATFCGGRDVDPVVHPNHRGQGLFSRLLAFGLEHFTNIDFFYNFANTVSAPGFYRQGWRGLSHCDDRIRQLGYSQVVSREFVFWLLGRLGPAVPDNGNAREVSATELRELLATNPQHRTLAPDCLQVVRDAAYLNWRYLDNPMQTYRYFITGNGNTWGLAVVRHTEGDDRVFVIDLADFGHTPKLGYFASKWSATFPAAQIVVWSTVPASLRPGWLGNPARRGKGLPLLIREFPGRHLPNSFDNPKKWALTHGDLEIS